MERSCSSYMEVVIRILRYLKGALGEGVLYKKNGHLRVRGLMLIG